MPRSYKTEIKPMIDSEIIKIGEIPKSERFKELELQAFKNTIDISNFAPAEYKYFDKLREISYEYNQSAKTEQDKKIAAKCKSQIYKDYCNDVEDNIKYIMNMQHWQDFIKKSESLRIEICKTDRKGEMLDLALRCIGIMIDDDGVFYKNAVKNLNTIQK